MSLAAKAEPLEWRGIFAASAPIRRRTLKRLFARMPARPLLKFCYMYFFRRGFLDGRPGYEYCRLLAFYETLIAMKERELGMPPQKGGLRSAANP